MRTFTFPPVKTAGVFLLVVTSVLFHERLNGVDHSFRKDSYQKQVNEPTPRETQTTSLIRNAQVLRKYVEGHPFCPQRPTRNIPSVDNRMYTPPPWKSATDMTSSKFTVFTIVGNPSSYHVCDEVELRIEARNGHNKQKSFGGDYFRVKIFTRDRKLTTSSTSDGEVWDHGNGTYTAYITLKWSGSVTIHVILYHPSEVVFLLERYKEIRPQGFRYHGLFVSAKNPTVREEKFCSYMPLFNSETSCNVSREGVQWFCERPKNPLLSCEDWAMHRVRWDTIKTDEFSPLNETERIAFEMTRQRQPITGPVTVIDVHQQIEGDIGLAMKNLPKCNIRSFLQTPRVSGFYMNGVWISPYCDTHRFMSVESVKQCMSGKNWHYYGDSTNRQLFLYQKSTLKLNSTRDMSSPEWCSRLNASDSIYNIHTYFEFHHVPIHHDSWLNLTLIRSVSSYFENIRSDMNIVIIVTIWAHVTQVPLWFYRKQIQQVIDAAHVLYSRNPRAVVILKGANTREHHHSLHYIVSSGWYARQLNEIVREMVSQHDNIGYVDVWESTNAQLRGDSIHPNNPHTENLNRMIMSMIC